jgi:hypothetical protein
MNKEQERERLHDLVFEGAPEWAKWAVKLRIMGRSSYAWVWLSDKPVKGVSTWLKKQPVSLGFNESICKTQPDTELDWPETLIRRQS